MLVRPMIYRHLHHCLSSYIPTSGVHRVWPSRTILILGSQPSKNIGPLAYSYLGCPTHPQRASDAKWLPNPPFYLPKWRQECCVYLSLSTREDMPILVKECTQAPSDQELAQAPSQSGTCQTSLLARDSHQQLLLMGPLFAWSISFLDVMKFSWASFL